MHVFLIILWKSSHKKAGPAGEMNEEIYSKLKSALERRDRVEKRRRAGYDTWTRVTGPYRIKVRGT